MNYILSQISGYIALIFISISYFCRKKSKFMLFQIIADIFYAGSYLFVNLYVAGLITIVSTIRCIVFYFCEKKEYKHTLSILPIFIVGYIIVAIIFWTELSDIVPLITATFYTFAYVLKNVQIIRYITLIPNTMLIIYNIIFRTYSNAVLDILETFVVIASIITFHKIRKNELKQLENTNLQGGIDGK